MSDMADNLARAERSMEQGFTQEAIAYALIALTHSTFPDDEWDALQSARREVRKRKWGGPGSSTSEQDPPGE